MNAEARYDRGSRASAQVHLCFERPASCKPRGLLTGPPHPSPDLPRTVPPPRAAACRRVPPQTAPTWLLGGRSESCPPSRAEATRGRPRRARSLWQSLRRRGEAGQALTVRGPPGSGSTPADYRPGVHRSYLALSRDPGSRVRLTVSQPMRPSPPGSGVPPPGRGLPRGGGRPDPSDPGETPIIDTDPDPGVFGKRGTLGAWRRPPRNLASPGVKAFRDKKFPRHRRCRGVEVFS